jgi:hypothetical protein
MKGNPANGNWEKVFEGAKELDAEIIAGEYAFVTPLMKEGDFLEKYNSLGEAIKFIRVK